MIRKMLIISLFVVLTSVIYGESVKIYSDGKSAFRTLSLFLSKGNSSLGQELTDEFAKIYIEESKIEGINWDIAFVQMCLETGFLKYGGLVEPGQNNFCGLGSFDSKKGASFPTIREGIRAHIQHLKAYATEDDLVGELIDPRFHLVKRGSANDVMALAGRWAEDPKYGIKLKSLLKRMNYLEYEDSILLASLKEEEDKKLEIHKTDPNILPPQADDDALKKSGWLSP